MKKSTLAALIVFIVIIVLICVLAGVMVAIRNSRKPYFYLSFEPKPPDSESILVSYKTSDAKATSYWIKRLDEFLEPYTKPRSPQTSITDCYKGTPPEADSNQVCDVRVDYWSPCTSDHAYHFNSSRSGPCIFLTLNKNPEWMPEYYNSSTVLDIMPDYLKQSIRHYENVFGVDSTGLKIVWVSCEGENPADVENIGPMVYMPTFGFDGAYFPVVNEKEYLQPLVAVFFEQPSRGILINVQCKAWARNIKHEEGEGVVHFELMIDY